MTSPPVLRLGVDVGGTNTDAVLLDKSARSVVASAKHPTTPDVTLGIQHAVEDVLNQVPYPTNVQAISIGTTHFVNALIERDSRRLDRVAVIRLCGPFTRGTPPFVGFPPDLRSLLEGPCFLVSGGLQIDGSEIAPVQPSEIESACREIVQTGIRVVVVSAVFAPIDFVIKQEEQVASIVRKALKHVVIVCSKEVAHIGLLERENAAILNASLVRYARKTVSGFQRAARALGLRCPVFITSNDGMLLSCTEAARLPIRTFSSGPTNSMRGAAFLASLGSDISKQSALVVDIGGTTTDIGMLLFVAWFPVLFSSYDLQRPSGFPRQAAAHHELCGVLLNFSMPHVTSIGLGGGSHVRQDPGTNKVTVGPTSVGHTITSQALVFNGPTLTATDIAVAAGRASVGDSSRVADINPAVVEGAQRSIKRMLQNTLDAMKTSAGEVPIYLVGGGSILAPDELQGVSRVHRFPHYDVANAISGIIDSFEDTSSTPVSEVRKTVEARAINRAVSAGADPHHVKIVESEVIPIAYTSGRCRFYVKAAGEWNGVPILDHIEIDDTDNNCASSPGEINQGTYDDFCTLGDHTRDQVADVLSYIPNVRDNQWFLSVTDLEWIADGCYVLGCGGGGSPLHTLLELKEMARAGSVIRVVDLASMSSDAVVGWGGGMGSPEVLMGNGFGWEDIMRRVQNYGHSLGHEKKIAKPDALCALEIGGTNGMINMITGSDKNYNVPIIDGDFMQVFMRHNDYDGLTSLKLTQTTPNVFDPSSRGLNLLPSAISSGDGNIVVGSTLSEHFDGAFTHSSQIMTSAKRDTDADAIMRAACVEMGTHVGMAIKPLKAKDLQTMMIANTVSLSWRIGRAIMLARKQSNIGDIGRIIVDAVGGSGSAKVLFSGKITDVRRRLYKGHTIGEVVVTALSTDEDYPNNSKEFMGMLVIPFKNENLYAEHISEDGKTTVKAAVPDLIALLDAQNGSALGTQEYKYGLRVVVIGITGAPQWTGTPRGMETGGPGAFGFHDIPYVPLGVYSPPKSVIDEFGHRN
ncbi:hypothetical protein ID866_5152 [Astraeus odoratus]|nr:hypothetical protein ID866_5152 [Astraeus odoratus]